MEHHIPPRLRSGDRIAIVSPSSGLASVFPWVYKLGLKRLEEIFKLRPVEYPSALEGNDYLASHPAARAADLNAAFSDTSINAIIATIGGNDQIRILDHLNKDTIASNIKAFIGYSDSTNLHLYLWKLGIVSYYGGGVMTQLAMQGKMHDYTIKSWQKALFEKEIGNINPSENFTDFDLDWSEPSNLYEERPMEIHDGWHWFFNDDSIVSGRLWGGCVEILGQHLALKKYLPAEEEFANIILYLETSEEMPSAEIIYRFMTTLGELGILSKLKGILIARPKSQFCGVIPTEGRECYVRNQESAIKRSLIEYKTNFPVVFNMNFGHTDPQMLIPHGGLAIINPRDKLISFGY